MGISHSCSAYVTLVILRVGICTIGHLASAVITGVLTGRCLVGISHSCFAYVTLVILRVGILVTGCRNYLLFYQNLVTYQAVLSFRQARSRASRCNCSVYNFGVTGFRNLHLKRIGLTVRQIPFVSVAALSGSLASCRSNYTIRIIRCVKLGKELIIYRLFTTLIAISAHALQMTFSGRSRSLQQRPCIRVTGCRNYLIHKGKGTTVFGDILIISDSIILAGCSLVFGVIRIYEEGITAICAVQLGKGDGFLVLAIVCTDPNQ